VPDEFYNWVRNTEANLRSQYAEIESHVRAVLNKEIAKRNPPLTRKQLAIKYQDYKYKAIMFQILDNKEYKESIWRLIRPKAEKPFTETT
jgi:RNA ligase